MIDALFVMLMGAIIVVGVAVAIFATPTRGPFAATLHVPPPPPPPTPDQTVFAEHARRLFVEDSRRAAQSYHREMRQSMGVPTLGVCPTCGHDRTVEGP